MPTLNYTEEDMKKMGFIRDSTMENVVEEEVEVVASRAVRNTFGGWRYWLFSFFPFIIGIVQIFYDMRLAVLAPIGFIAYILNQKYDKKIYGFNEIEGKNIFKIFWVFIRDLIRSVIWNILIYLLLIVVIVVLKSYLLYVIRGN